MKKPSTPTLGELVFLGGGHAQVSAIKNFAMFPVPGLRLTIVTSDYLTPYSGMLPGYVEGKWNDDEIHIDLAHLAQFAGARLVVSTCTGIDADRHKLFFNNRPPLHFDLLSINIGGQPDLSAITGAKENVIPVKPISNFQALFHSLLESGLPKKIAVIGGGAAGCELVLALNKRWHYHGVAPQITLYSRTSTLMSQMSSKASHLMLKALHDAGIKIQLKRAVKKIDKGTLYFDNEETANYETCFLVSAVRPPEWLKSSALELDKNGFIEVHPTLQSTSHPHIFAAGDIATVINNPRPKAGVFAVRAGAVLSKNLRKKLFGKRLVGWSAQKRYLAIIGTSDGSAIASWGHFGFKAKIFLKLKYWIDRRFMEKYQNLLMPTVPAPVAFQGIFLPTDLHRSDPAFAAMRCLGCAAKTGHKVLESALEDATNIARLAGADPVFLPDIGIETDAAVMVGPPHGHNLVQSVDVLSEIVSDPFLLGRIAAFHALSDLYAVMAKPTSALAIINLPEASLSIQTNQLTQILAGGLLALSESGVKLNGGHTSEGGTLSVGFSVTGYAKNDKPAMARPGDAFLVITKPIGTGVIMSANMQLIAKAKWVESAILQMAKSNRLAAKHFDSTNVIAATDITGFGLARHALNLSRRVGAKGCVLNLRYLPLLAGAAQLFSSGVRSSLHNQNCDAVVIDSQRLSENTEFTAHAEALFDPQTSGGLLGVLTRRNAEHLVELLKSDGHNAAIIGHLDFNNESVQLSDKIIES
ncbi:selenide, water dikinase SelD [Candidatus Puniceispirillum sp.]|nr:selenide, water dikinase SelD [Candidatus Puniceispirillum sp.]